MKIIGFNDRGEAKIADDYGNVVGYGELLLDDAHIVGIECGDIVSLSLKVEWTRHEADAARLINDFFIKDVDEFLRTLEE